jgi:diguanylate cyclase (GGDEF)-like protein
MPILTSKNFGFIEGNPVATFVIDIDHRVVSWNKACEVLTGIPAARMLGTCDQWRAFYPGKRPVMADLILNGLVKEEVCYFYQEKFRSSALIPGACEAEDFFPNFGSEGRWLFFTAAPIHDTQGHVVGAIETLQDFTERRKAEAALKEREALLAQILHNTTIATVVIDSAHQITHWNRACETLTGLQAENVIFTRPPWNPPSAAATPFLSDLMLDGKIESDFHRFFSGELRKSPLIDGAFEIETFRETDQGDGKWLYLTTAPLTSVEGDVIGAIETMQDITERRKAEESLRQSEVRYKELSVTDSLTKLYNARHFKAMLDYELDRAQRYRRPLTLVIADVDNFKSINDTFGHAEGDRVLIALSDVIKTCLRSTDTSYRYGGEEFAILMPEVPAQNGMELAERVRSQLCETPIAMPDGTVIQATISIGVTNYHPGDDAKSLFSRADGGMYQAKRHGKNCAVLVEPPVGP